MNNPVDPRALHVIFNLERGGAQEVVCVLAEACAAEEKAFLVCSLADGPLRARLEAAGATVTIIRGPSCRYTSVIRYFAEMKRIGNQIAALAKVHKADIIQTHLLNFLDLAVIRVRDSIHGPAIVWTFHGDFLPCEPGPLLWARRAICRWMYRMNAARVDAMVSVSRDLGCAVTAALGSVDGKLHIIPNAPNPRKFSGAQTADDVRAKLGVLPGARVIMFLGRLAPVKGCDLLIRAAPIVLAGVPDAVFLIAGEGAEAAALVAMAEKTGVVKQVRFLGARDDIADLFAAADVFCLPSRQEGMSLALLEAMSAGKPVVASDFEANREIVEHNRTGLLIKPGDVDALAVALMRLLAHPDEAHALGRAAKTYALGKHSALAQHQAYAKLYRDICAARTCR